MWVIQAEGAFSCAFGRSRDPVGFACWQARGAVPQGRVVTLVVADPPGGVPLDVSVEPTARDLSRLGAVVRLLG